MLVFQKSGNLAGRRSRFRRAVLLNDQELDYERKTPGKALGARYGIIGDETEAANVVLRAGATAARNHVLVGVTYVGVTGGFVPNTLFVGARASRRNKMVTLKTGTGVGRKAR